jgi:hypothetical protein
MTTLFICILYVRGHKDINVKRHGIDPFELWRDRAIEQLGTFEILLVVVVSFPGILEFSFGRW